MKSKFLLTIALFIMTGIGGLSSVHGFELAQQAFYKVILSAPATTHSGTNSKIWFRLYSENQSSWGGWRTIDGLDAGAYKTVNITAGAGFTDLSKVQVYVGENDGVRLNFDITYSSGALMSFPMEKWVKNNYFTFDLYSIAAAGTFCCDSYANGSGWGCTKIPSDGSCPGQTLVDCTGNTSLDSEGNLTCE